MDVLQQKHPLLTVRGFARAINQVCTMDRRIRHVFEARVCIIIRLKEQSKMKNSKEASRTRAARVLQAASLPPSLLPQQSVTVCIWFRTRCLSFT